MLTTNDHAEPVACVGRNGFILAEVNLVPSLVWSYQADQPHLTCISISDLHYKHKKLIQYISSILFDLGWPNFVYLNNQ